MFIESFVHHPSSNIRPAAVLVLDADRTKRSIPSSVKTVWCHLHLLGVSRRNIAIFIDCYFEKYHLMAGTGGS